MEYKPVGLREIDCPLWADDSQVDEIDFVATQDDVRRVTVRIRLKLTQPALYVDERLLIGHVKQQQETHCITKKGICQTAKPVKRRLSSDINKLTEGTSSTAMDGLSRDVFPISIFQR
jgi:hypothetical protein